MNTIGYRVETCPIVFMSCGIHQGTGFGLCLIMIAFKQQQSNILSQHNTPNFVV